MSSQEDMDFQATEAGSDTYPAQAGSIKKGAFCMLKGKACKVTDYSTAKVGKHGSAKAKIIGVCVFTGNKCEEIHPTSHNVLVPNINRTSYSLVDIIDDDFCALLLETDLSLREDIRVPAGELGVRIREYFAGGKAVEVVLLSACGKDAIVEVRARDD